MKQIRTMEELASVSGISRPTLSKYFDDPSRVRKSSRARIEEALEKYNYQPNLFAINQNRRSTRNIGVLVPTLADPFFAELVRRIESDCVERGYRPIVLCSHGESEGERDALNTLSSMKIAGAVVAPLSEKSARQYLAPFTENIPTVLLDSFVGVGKAFVGNDNASTVRLIVDYLCETGEPPCFVAMPSVNANASERQTAFERSMEALGHEPKVIQSVGQGWDFERYGYEQASELLKGGKLPSSTVLCANDRIAIGWIAAAYAQGMRVGKGANCALRVAGHDDHPLAQFTCPPLTTVAQDFTALSQGCVDELFELIGATGRTGVERSEKRCAGKLIVRHSA